GTWRCRRSPCDPRSAQPASAMMRHVQSSGSAIEGDWAMAIRIGANPIGWSNDDMPELGGEIPLEQCLSEAKAAGFEGMELGNKFPRESGKLRPILDKHGLVLIGGWHSIFLIERDAESEFAEAAHHRKLLKDMGTNVFIVPECTRTIH